MWHEFGGKKINRPENKVPKKIQAATNRSKKKCSSTEKSENRLFLLGTKKQMCVRFWSQKRSLKNEKIKRILVTYSSLGLIFVQLWTSSVTLTVEVERVSSHFRVVAVALVAAVPPLGHVLPHDVGQLQDLRVGRRTNVAVDQFLEELEATLLVDEGAIFCCNEIVQERLII